MTQPCADSSSATGSRFATTRWTLVRGATGADTTRARWALEELCRSYWRPIYAFVRRLGNSPHDAQDLTQEFFARLLGAGSLGQVNPDRGRFRSFLLASLKHFLANEWDKRQTLKRGGGQVMIPLDPDPEAHPALAIPDPAIASPEQVFQRQWALAMLDRVLERLAEEHAGAGKSVLFEHLKPTLTLDRGALPYARIATELGASEGAIKVAVHRLRVRYRALLREEIAATLEDPAEIETELRELFAALAS